MTITMTDGVNFVLTVEGRAKKYVRLDSALEESSAVLLAKFLTSRLLVPIFAHSTKEIGDWRLVLVPVALKARCEDLAAAFRVGMHVGRWEMREGLQGDADRVIGPLKEVL